MVVAASTFTPSESNKPQVSKDPLDESPTFVVFLVDDDRQGGSQGRYLRSNIGKRLVPLLWHSVLKVYPDAHLVILTTPSTALPKLKGPIDIVARPLGDGPLLFERMRATLAFLETASANRNYLFLETDMLMLNRLHLDQGDEWDVALTYKPRGMWINSGILLIRSERKNQALTFLRTALSLYQKRYLHSKKWGADQAALRDAIGLTRIPDAGRVYPTPSATVLLLPCEKFNVFARNDWSVLLDKPDAFILHFTGIRKRLMPSFYWLHIKASPKNRLVWRVVIAMRRTVRLVRQRTSGAGNAA